MQVSSVNTATGSATSSVQPRTQEADTRQADAARAAAEAERARSEQQAPPAPPPKPVVNAEGQKTGQIISVTA